MRRDRLLVSILLAGLCLLAPTVRAEDPGAGALVDVLRYDPDSPTARLVLDRLGRGDEKGWKALVTSALEQHAERPDLTERAARILAAARDPGRLEYAGRLYDRLEDDGLRKLLALGLARIYPVGAERLHAHLRRNAPGSLDLLRVLASKGLPKAEIEAAAAHDELKALATSLLGGRTPPGEELELLPRAREAARKALDPSAAAAFATAFARVPSVPMLRALAEVLREGDEDAALGAHCLLMQVSGKALGPDADLWLSWLAVQEGAYVPPDPVSDGAVAAAVRRGVRHLRNDLLADGVAYHSFGNARDSAMGATALAVLALRASGVPADDPAIVKAVETTMLMFDRGGRPGLKTFSHRWETYSLALLAMALRQLDRERMKDALVAIRDRLANGVLPNGQWTYTCPVGMAANRPPAGDNSNTQYANLGLRALNLAGIELPFRLWEIVDTHWRSTQQVDGVWGYLAGGRDSRKHPVQMTASGVAGIAIAHEGEDVAGASQRIAKDEAILKGLRYMGRSLLLTDFRLLTPYTLYAVERACVLTRTGSFTGAGKMLDWHREGAWRYLQTQNPDGSWGQDRITHWESQGFGKVTSTAFALLFLTKATATIGEGGPEKVVAVSVTPQEVATPPPNRAPAAPEATVAWQLPKEEPPLVLHVDESTVLTRTGEAEIRGRVEGTSLHVFVGDVEVVPDAQGAFALRVTVTEATPFEVRATAEGGVVAKASVVVRMDTTPPKITLNGPAVRPVGKQRLLIESDEPLDGVRVGGHYFPADGRQVVATAELGEYSRSLVVTAFDRVGNKTRESFPVEAVNRVLVLDGKSAVRVPLPSKPERFTLECWVRSPPVTKNSYVVSDAEYAGVSLLFAPEDGLKPAFGFHDASKWHEVHAKRTVKKDRWTHLALTYDGAYARLWVNGREAAELETTAYKRSTRALIVGGEPDRHNNPHQLVSGAIDEVRFSDVCRYTRSFRPEFSHAPDRHTVVLLHFDTDTEKAILDASGHHHHGTPLGAPKIEAEKR